MTLERNTLLTTLERKKLMRWNKDCLTFRAILRLYLCFVPLITKSLKLVITESTLLFAFCLTLWFYALTILLNIQIIFKCFCNGYSTSMCKILNPNSIFNALIWLLCLSMNFLFFVLPKKAEKIVKRIIIHYVLIKTLITFIYLQSWTEKWVLVVKC